MKPIRDKTIKEIVLLRDAQPGDRLYIGKHARWSEHGYGHVTVRKVKDMPGGLVQIKFVQPGLRIGGTVQKHVLPGDAAVERTRKLDARDGLVATAIDPSRIQVLA